LFSYWDGDGKAWPVHIVEGTIANDGLVTAKLRRLSELVGAPETRRLFVDFQDKEKPAGTITLENAPSNAFFAAATIAATVSGPERSHAGRYIAKIGYESRAQMHDILVRIVGGLPDDVFVSPATSKGWHDRFAYRGSAIGARQIDELLVKIFKRSANAQ
jgi:hypothetical protein